MRYAALIIALTLPFTYQSFSQSIEDIDKIPVYLQDQCDGSVSSTLCYYVKEEIRKSERFEITNERVHPAVGVNLLSMDVMNSSSVYSVSITLRTVKSQSEIDTQVEYLPETGSYSKNELRKKLKNTVNREYKTSSIGTCPSDECDTQAVNVVSFIDDVMDEPNTNSLKINILFYRQRQ